MRLDREELQVIAKVNWSLESLASAAWVLEKMDVFRNNTEAEPLTRELGQPIYRIESLLRSACGELEEECRDQIRECKLGGPDADLQFSAFLGPGDVLAALPVATKHVGDVLVVPADEVDRRTYMGPAPTPMRVDRRFQFAVRLGVGQSWSAQCEAMRVVEAFVRASAVKQKSELWCMLCSPSFLYLGPLRLPASRFSLLVFEVEELNAPE